MKCSVLIALFLLAIAAPATAATTMQLALPSQQPEGTPPTPVGDPDVPPLGLDVFQPDGSYDEPSSLNPADD